jgi:hypothetical protein
MNKNLKDIARKVERRVIAGWEPVTADIRREYNLNGQQVKTVKDYVKDSFADKGALWVYDPRRNGGAFSLAVNINAAGQRHLQKVDLEHAIACLGDRKRVFKAGAAAGHVTPEELAKAQELVLEAVTSLTSTQRIGWTDVTDEELAEYEALLDPVESDS